MRMSETRENIIAELLDSQYRAGAKAGWNAQFADDPAAAIAALIRVNPGDLAALRRTSPSDKEQG